MAKSRTNRRFRKKSQKSLRKFSRTRKYKGGMKIPMDVFLTLLLSCTYLVDASFYKFFKAAAVTHAAIKVNKVIRDRVQRESAPAPPVAASTGNGGIIIATVEQLQQLPTPPSQPTFAPALPSETLVAVKCDESEFDNAVIQLNIDNKMVATSEDEQKQQNQLNQLNRTLSSLEKL